jgi:hypothetical protein
MDPYLGTTHPYYKSYKSCKSYALCYDENYNITIIKNIRNIYKKFVFKKMLVDNVISKVIKRYCILRI